jgi:hypothetical protein
MTISTRKSVDATTARTMKSVVTTEQFLVRHRHRRRAIVHSRKVS